MIYLCPHCGHQLPACLKDGIAFCPNCNQDLDTSQKNRIMSGAWMLSRQKNSNLEGVARAVSLTGEEVILLEAFLVQNEYTVDEFRRAITSLGVGN